MCQRELTASPIKGQTSCDPRHGPGHDSVASLCSKAAVGGPSETKQRPRVPTEHPIQSGARRIPTSVHDGNQFVLGQLSGAAACHDRLRHPLVRALPETRARNDDAKRLAALVRRYTKQRVISKRRVTATTAQYSFCVVQKTRRFHETFREPE
ncbi:hypothetical protein MRX96_035721 [Rhipicephalus microplus]